MADSVKETNKILKNLKVGGKTDSKEITLSLDTNIYASGDVLADTQEIHHVVTQKGGTGIIHSVILLDKDDQAQDLDLVFLRSNVSIGTENAAVSITDTNADEIIGVIEIAAGDYIDLANSQIVTKTNVGIGFQANVDTQSIYVAAISRGTGTYTASGITIKVVILQD